ncbi:MAG: hypothetical protein EBR94_00960 [Bacteroidetes bacterium]|nr:hypothetical protein [Bacteroidota bacterium]
MNGQIQFSTVYFVYPFFCFAYRFYCEQPSVMAGFRPTFTKVLTHCNTKMFFVEGYKSNVRRCRVNANDYMGIIGVLVAKIFLS